MTKIGIFIRHGESTANSGGIVSHDLEGYPLTAKGMNEARRAGENLSPISGTVDRFVVSPLVRTIQTADEVAKGMGYAGSTIIDERLRETFLGPYNNRPVSELPKFHRSEFGIEPFEENGMRLYECAQDYEGVSVFVSHNLPIKALICKILDLEEEDAKGVDIRNASISIIDFEKGKVLCIGAGRPSGRTLDRIKNRL
ncbi:MAG: phosphoglycerate mutase family protein [Candidatus Thermoplasmatota archaeon]|nr:phosphoglycerate mutase family protein [Candidatus Thermoplasmatota archaeon]MCL5790741.1 phosphoglycerate mutase family protein [Candidatus Thermoplasmatota archaeon]